MALALAGCASTPPEEDPVQIKLKDLDTRLERIERVVANQSLLDLANQADSLRNDLRAMHNDVDQLSNNLEANRKQQRDLYADLDRRMKSLESRGVGAAGAAAAAGSGDAGSAVAGAAGDAPTPEAQTAFQRVVDKYPQSRKRPDALLKIGYCQYESKQWDAAKATLTQVATQFPDAPAGHLAQQRLDKMATEKH